MDEDEFRAIIADNIQRTAVRRQMSLSEVARQAGIARSSLFAIVYGERAATTDTILKIATALRVEPWRLLKPARR